jgi:cellulose synthase/poly-beta-1,6-N-acetylglucosamine synthase-like glycosyltransferase
MEVQVRMAVMVLLVFAALLKWTLLTVTFPLLVELLLLTVGSLLPARRTEVGNDGPLSARHSSTGHAELERYRHDFESSSAQPLKRLMMIVPSHNEELCIARCVQSLAEAGGAANVLVIAHNCSDATAEIARKTGALVEVVNDPSLAGKGHALKHGFDYAFGHCGADAVMIVDADSTVSSNITRVVMERLASSPVVQCRYQVKNFTASWRTGLTSLAFLGINVVRARGRDHLGLSCGIFGNGFAMRREVLEEVAYDAHSIVEDMEFHLSLVERGYRVRFIEEAYVLGDMPLSASTSASQHSRWEGGRQRLLRDWGLRLCKNIFRGKLAMLEALVDLLGLPLALEVFCLMILLLFPMPFTRLYVLSAFGVILLHMAAVVRISPDPMGSLKALLLTPAYLFWRVSMVTSAVRASGKNATWVRTTRDSVVEVAPSQDILAVESIKRTQEIS